MPGSYAPPPGKAKKVPPYHTVCQVFVGKGAAFEGCQELHLPSDFPDGPSNTLLIVEARRATRTLSRNGRSTKSWMESRGPCTRMKPAAFTKSRKVTGGSLVS